MYYCGDCSIGFEKFGLKANHIRWHHGKRDVSNLKIAMQKSNINKYGEWINVKCKHSECNNLIKQRSKNKKRKYCSVSCSNKNRDIRWSKESKKKLSESISKLWKSGTYDHLEPPPKLFSSKREREIVKFFKDKYPEYKFKSGGMLKYNNFLISRDLYSDELKICFEYDGIWHFKDIHGQLKNKQEKDKPTGN